MRPEEVGILEVGCGTGERTLCCCKGEGRKKGENMKGEERRPGEERGGEGRGEKGEGRSEEKRRARTGSQIKYVREY